MTIIEFSPEVGQFVPVFAALFAILNLGGMALYTKRVARLAQEKNARERESAAAD